MRTAAALLLLGWLSSGTAAAQEGVGDARLRRCVESLRAAAADQGADSWLEPKLDFLTTGEQRSFVYTLEQDGCAHFVAIGHRNVQDMNLSLYHPSGRRLADDEGRTAHPHAHFCSRRGRDIVVHLEMIDGGGEIRLAAFLGGPPELRGMDEIARHCESAGRPRPTPVDVGPEPDGPPIQQGLQQVAQQLFALGYREAAPTAFGSLPEQRRESRRLPLAPHTCYAVAAIGSSGVSDMDLRIFDSSSGGKLAGADVTRRRSAVVKLCTTEANAYLLDVRMYAGEGAYLIKTFDLDDRAALPVGVTGNARLAYQEMEARMAQRGLSAEPVGWGLLRPGRTQSMPVPLAAGQCYALGALASGDFAGQDLDMVMLDVKGRAVASEQGPGSNPLLFHCPRHSGTYRAVAKGHDMRKPGRFLVVLGKSGDAK